jgi:hypothetical protein
MKLSREQWTLIAAGAGTVAGLLARRAAAKGWEGFTQEATPTVKENPDTSKLLIWVGISALATALAATSAKLAVHALRNDTRFSLPGRDDDD